LDPIEPGAHGEINIRQTQGDLVGMGQRGGAHDEG